MRVNAHQKMIPTINISAETLNLHSSPTSHSPLNQSSLLKHPGTSNKRLKFSYKNAVSKMINKKKAYQLTRSIEIQSPLEFDESAI